MKTRTKVLLSALSVGALGTVAALGVFGAFSATTQNAGNEITTGTVALHDNDTGQAMFSINNAQPGDSWTRCIKVTYSGSVEAEVRSYVSQSAGSLLPYLRVLSERGQQAGGSVFPSCNGFVPEAGPTPVETPLPPMTGTWELGSPMAGPTGANWQPGESVVLRVTMRLVEETPDSAQGASTGVTTIHWEARNVS